MGTVIASVAAVCASRHSEEIVVKKSCTDFESVSTPTGKTNYGVSFYLMACILIGLLTFFIMEVMKP